MIRCLRTGLPIQPGTSCECKRRKDTYENAISEDVKQALTLPDATITVAYDPVRKEWVRA
jgi:hypothetical protein